MERIDELREHFNIVPDLCSFLKSSAVKEEYERRSFKRLIDTRWSDHFTSCRAMIENYDEAVQALRDSGKSEKLNILYRSTATGLTFRTTSDSLIF